MKYCVIKGTSIVIDGSINPSDVMIQNAFNAGLSESEVEILTEEEYESRKASEPVPPVVDADEILKAKIELITINTLIDIGVI